MPKPKAKPKKGKKRGPKPARLVIDGEFEEVVEEIMKKANKKVAKPKKNKGRAQSD